MKKTVLITGASGGIGGAIVKKFAHIGYNVVICYNNNKEHAEKLLSEISETGCDALMLKADVSDENQVENLFAEAEKAFGGIDVLINNAGISQIKVINNVTSEEWDRMFAVNTKSAYLCSRRAISYMVKQHFGRIINISSIWGICGASCEVPYSASKSALHGFTKALAKELAPSGITVNCICPGLIDTAMNAHLSNEDMEDFVSEIPVMRIGKPEEIAHACAFFADEMSGYITSQILAVDGGIT